MCLLCNSIRKIQPAFSVATLLQSIRLLFDGPANLSTSSLRSSPQHCFNLKMYIKISPRPHSPTPVSFMLYPHRGPSSSIHIYIMYSFTHHFPLLFFPLIFSSFDFIFNFLKGERKSCPLLCPSAYIGYSGRYIYGVYYTSSSRSINHHSRGKKKTRISLLFHKNFQAQPLLRHLI